MTELLRTFNTDFEKLVQLYSDKPAFVLGTDTEINIITYSQLNSLINRCAKFYENHGLKPGAVITAILPSCADSLICFLAAIKSGYKFAPFSCTATKREIRAWLDLVKPQLCLSSELMSEEVKQAISESKVKTQYLLTDSKFAWLPNEESNSNQNLSAKLYLATSGTTGEPKAMVLDADRLWSSGCAFAKFHNLPNGSLRFWNYLPMSYLGGLFNLCMIPLCTGGSLVIDEPFTGKTILSYWHNLDRFDINALWFAPTIAQGLLAMAERTGQNLASKYQEQIKVAFIGMAAVKLDTKQKFKETFGIELLENFALSETTFFTSETINNINKRVEASMGEVLPYTKLKFVPVEDYEGEDTQTPTEIYVKTPFLFEGYLKKEGVLDLKCDDEGYFPTKDLGFLNQDGILIVTGRTRDIVKKGGYFIALREIEILAEKHPAVKEAAAVRIEHDFYGESFNLFVILNENFEEAIKTEINQFLHENLVKYKWPNKIAICKNFPRTASGKIKKHLLSA